MKAPSTLTEILQVIEAEGNNHAPDSKVRVFATMVYAIVSQFMREQNAALPRNKAGDAIRREVLGTMEPLYEQMLAEKVPEFLIKSMQETYNGRLPKDCTWSALLRGYSIMSARGK